MASASFNDGVLTLSKNGPTSDDLAAGATVNGFTHVVSASFDVTGYCGAGSPRLNVWTESAEGRPVVHFYGCAAHKDDAGHVSITFADAASDGSGNGGVSPTDTVIEIDFVQDEMGSTSISNIHFVSTPPPNVLLCFDGTTDTANGETGGVTYGGVCTRTANGARLNNTVPVPAGDYSGVYYAHSSLAGKTLAQISILSFSYTDVAQAGSPRISLPVMTGAGVVYAFISAFHCNNGEGLVDPINDETCTIFITGGPDSGYPNWDAFAAAYPSSTVGMTPFVIADDAGIWDVSNVHLGE